MNMKPGFYPFWFWNDRLDEAEVRWQIREMHAQGVKGFFIHPRQGLEQPYLSDAFFTLVKTAVEAARAVGMVANLYDEYPYPSGAAGGEALVGNPEFHATELLQKSYDLEGGPVRITLPRGKLLALRAYPLRDGAVDWKRPLDLRSAAGMVLEANSYIEQGLTGYNQKRFFASDPAPVLETTLPPGSWRIFAAAQCEVTRHKYWGHFLDVLNPAAVQEYIRLTHERYYARLGAEFGRTIQAIFTDETHPGWSALIPENFRDAYGYDLLEHIEALVDYSHPRAEQVREHFYTLVSHLFFVAFEHKISAWCREHNIAYCGEKPYRRFSQMAFMDIPGCEPGHTKAGAPLDLLGWNARGNARAAASAAYFYGKAGALDECYHSVGWSGTLQDAKLLAEAMTLHGIRYLVPHGFFYSTNALRKHDAPPTFFFQMPYWRHFGKLSERIDRIWEHLEGTHIDADVLLVDPTSGRPEHEDKQAYVDLQAALMARRIEFLIVDADVLQAARKVEAKPASPGRICPRDVSVQTVIVPPMPSYSSDLILAMYDVENVQARLIKMSREDSIEAVLRQVQCDPPALTVRGAGMQCVRRRQGERLVWFCLNPTAEAVEVTIDTALPIREIPLDGLPPALVKRDGGYARRAAPFDSFLLEYDPNLLPGAEIPTALPVMTMRIMGEMAITPRHANLLRLGDWEMALMDEGSDAGAVHGLSAVVPAVPLANQLAASKLPFTPDWAKTFGLQPRMELPTLRVRYSAAFKNDYSGAVELVMEPDSIVGIWSLWINYAGPFTAADFHPTEAHVRGSLALPITDHLRGGENTITVEVTTGRTDGGLLNPLYLAGAFAATLAPIGLATRKERGFFEDWEGSGLPFYAGVVDYALTFDVPRLPEDDTILLELQTPEPFLDAAEISVNGSDFLPVLWQPRRAVIARSLLLVGRNEAVVRVSTTLIRAFEGTWFDDSAHCYRKVGEKKEL